MVVEMSWISKCFVVRLVVSCIFRVSGWMSRFVVLIRMRVGISSVGVFFGKRWVREMEGWFCSFVRRVVSYRGKVSVRFIDNWVVGVNVYGSSFSRLISSKKIIRDVRIRVYLCFFLFSGVISCFVIRLMNYSCRVDS